jgi:hypothetical protein
VVRAQAHGDPLAYLDRATARPATAGAGDDLDTARAQPGVDVIGREEVGGYDVSRLRAGDPRELAAWLHDNGYVLPAGAAPILADYVRAGWRYVAIRLAPGSAGRLRPLRIAFPSRRAVYPMRLTQLGSEPVNLTLYVLASGRRATPGLSTAWKGRVSELPERPPPELRRLIPEGAYLTKLVAEGVAPRRFTRDLTLAATRSPGARDDGGGGIRWWEITGLALLGLVAAGALARRHTGRR